MFGKNKYANYLNMTSNRCESFNQKLKLIIHKNSTLPVFFSDLMIFLATRTTEKNTKAIKLTMKRKRPRLLDPVLTSYADFLTSFAYDKLSYEYGAYKHVDIVRIDY